MMPKIKWDDPKCILRLKGLCNREGDMSVYPEGHIVGGSSCICWDPYGWPLPGARTEDCPYCVVEKKE